MGIKRHGWRLARLIIVTAAVILPLQPLLTGHLPWQGDGLLHFYRLGALANAIDWSWLYPRWLPDLALGAGFPLFNYYAPLSYYAVLPLYLLGGTAGFAMRLSYLLAYILMIGSAGGWSRHNRWGYWGAVTGTAPYLAVNLYHRAALAELWGLGALSLALWLVQRLAERPARGRLTAAAAAYALLMVAHNITALIGTPFLIAIAFRPRNQGFKKSLALRLGWLPLGLALSAFFWIPALLESGFVQLNRLTQSSNFSYVNHFLSLSDWLAWPPPADPALINPPLPLAVGWGQLLLALVGLVILTWRIREGGRKTKDERPEMRDQRREIKVENPDKNAFGALLAAGFCLYMTTHLSTGLWSLVPGLSLVQFPWRFLGPAAIFLGMINAFALQTLWQSRRPGVKAAALLVPLLMVAQQLPYLFPPPQPVVPERILPADLAAFEVQTGWFGTTSAADYLPVGVTILPREPVTRPQFVGRTLTVAANEPGVSLILPQFAFPGWEAEAGGRRLKIESTPQTGLIAVEPPEDARLITLTFRGTRLQRLMGWLSFLTLAGTFGTVLVKGHWSKWSQWKFDWRLAGIVVIVATAVVGLKLTVLDRINSPLKRSLYDGGTVEGVSSTAVNFANRIELIGAELPLGPLPADQPIEIDLYWRGLALDEEVSIAVHVIDPLGVRVAQSDALHPAAFPLPRWRLDQYARDRHTLFLPPAASPGEYQLRLFVTDPSGLQQEFLDGSGRPLGVDYILGTVHITRAARPLTRADVSPQKVINHPLADGVTLLGIDPEITQTAPGETIIMSIYWEAAVSNPERPDSELTVVGEDGTVWFTQSLSANTPGPGWRPGEVRQDRYAIRLPAALPDGRVQINLAGQTLTDLVVVAPNRLFDLPDFTLSLDQPIGEAAILKGADAACSLNQPVCEVKLVWRAAAEFKDSYRVFVQLLGPDGRPVAQSDRPPTHQGENRPTPGWLPGEFLVDNHVLSLPGDLPAGRYQLITGLYNPTNGARLPTPEGDAVTVLKIDN